MTTEWTSKSPCRRTTLSERCKECPFYYKPTLCPAQQDNMKGVPKMKPQTIQKLYELKGRLEARDTILDSDVLFTERLREAMITDHYNGYARGKVETSKRWQQDNRSLLDAVCLIIKELEDAGE